MSNKKEVAPPTPRLENWYKMNSFADDGLVYVYGSIYDDLRFLDGVFIKTSSVVSIKKGVLTTANKTYKLGKKSVLF